MTIENGSARFHRRSNAALSPPTAKKTPKLLPVILSCCIFFVILCACLLAVLVLVGKHLYSNRNDKVVSVSITKNDTVITVPAKKQLLTRLPNDTVPVHYDVTLIPNLYTGKYEGNVNITINLMRTRRHLLLNSKDLNINSVELFYFNQSKLVGLENAKAIIDADSEMISIVTEGNDELLPGMYNLNIIFAGTMLNRSVGFYASRYKVENLYWRTIATSKFEPTYARQAFPCFDEPNMKAKFTAHIIKPKNDSSYIALSNMPETSQDVLETGIRVNFQESVKMSTYLACFIVCDFTYTENMIKTSGNQDVPLRVYATPAQLEKTKLAAEIGVGVIKYFIDYFKIPYPLPKLDLIAIPDFVSGAMEHWGLVTFRETSLLFDEQLSSAENKQRVATVISHELAHSWFGNLVTMDWWNDLWLNEGFATYIEYKGLHAVYPDWEMLDQFLIKTLHTALSIDATPASHPIVQTASTPDQISELFDSITYEKGGSVLRMLEGAVGETIFENGVTNYLKAHQWGNAVTQNLWNQLQKLVDEKLNITDFMNTWTIQMGYPIVTVTEDGDNYVITQKRFLKNPDNPGDQPSSFGYKWTIPVTYITDLNSTPELVWFNYEKSLINIPKPPGTKWIKFNHRQVGYYRVNYSSKQWELLAESIKNLSVGDRTHLLEDSFSIAESGELDYGVPLNLTKYLKAEFNYIPWSAAATKIIQLWKYLQSSLHYGNFQDYVIEIINPVYKNLTWNESSHDKHLQRRLRVTILSLACMMNHPDAMQEATKRFNQWLEDPIQNTLSQNLRSIVLKYGMVNSGKKEWEKLLELYKKEIDANEKMNILRGLAAVKEPWLLRRLIELGKDDQIIRRQDYFIMLQLIASNPIGTSIAWDYIRENWKALVDRFTLNDRVFGRSIPQITSRFSSDIKLKEMERFFQDNPESGAGKLAREQALVNVRNNIKWLLKNKDTVESWIQGNDPSLQ